MTTKNATHRSNTDRGTRARYLARIADAESRDELREYRMGSACPLLASAPIDRIVREVTTARNDVFRVRYADGQVLEIHARPESDEARIRELASAQ